MNIKLNGPLAILAAVLCFSVAAATPAEAATTEHHFNMYGNIGPNSKSYPVLGSTEIIHYSVGYANPRPLSVSLNEVCFGTQLAELDARLGQYGYTRVTYRAKASVPNCGDYGNVLYHLGNRLDTYSFRFTAQASGATEYRGAACAKFNAFAKVASCSAHMNAGGGREQQLDEYRTHMGIRYASVCRYLMGDFNDTPSNAWIYTYYNDYYDAMVTPAGTHDDGRKIDYMFGDKSSHTSSRSHRISPVNYSDHHYYEGTWNFSRTCNY